MGPRSRSRGGVWPTMPAAASILALVCLAAYWNSFHAAFLLDNQTIILKDPRLRSADWQSVSSIFTRHYWWPSLESHLYRPLTTLSFSFNYAVLGNGESPAGYHAINLLLHGLNVCLAFSLVRRVTGRPLAALWAAAVFASHPLTVESVTNVVGRADLLAALSVLGGLACYRRFLGSAGGRAAGWLAGLGGSYLAGVLCKESAVVLPGLMLLHDLAYPVEGGSSAIAVVRRVARRVWPAYLAVVPGAALLLWARWVLFRYSPLASEFASDNPIVIAPFWTGLMTAAKVAGYYLALMAWPARLSCDYSYNEITLFGWTLAFGQDAHAWMALVVLALLALVAIVGWRRERAIPFFLGFAAIAFLPTSNVLLPIGTIMAERLMYLPLVGMAAAAALLLPVAGRRILDAAPAAARRALALAGAVVAVSVVAALTARTIARNEDWSSGERLWTTSAEAAPNSIKVIRALASLAMESDPTGGKADEALAIAARALRILEQAPLPLYHTPAALYQDVGLYSFGKGTFLSAHGEEGQARAAFGQSVAMFERAEAIDREINRQGRERLLRSGVRPEDVRDTGTASIRRDLGSAYLAVGQPAQAIGALTDMRRLQPDNFDASYALGIAEGAAWEAERARGNEQQAAQHLERAAIDLLQAILLDSTHQPSWEALRRVYGILSPGSDAVRIVDGKPTLNTDVPLAGRHFRQACVELVRHLQEGGLTDVAARWRRRMVEQLGVPSELFDHPAN